VPEACLLRRPALGPCWVTQRSCHRRGSSRGFPGMGGVREGAACEEGTRWALLHLLPSSPFFSTSPWSRSPGEKLSSVAPTSPSIPPRGPTGQAPAQPPGTAAAPKPLHPGGCCCQALRSARPSPRFLVLGQKQNGQGVPSVSFHSLGVPHRSSSDAVQ